MVNFQITPNFTFHEFIFGTNLPLVAIEMNIKALCDSKHYETIAESCRPVFCELQRIRKKYNVPIYITSGYRCYDWELFRKRSGTSKHVEGIAVDFQCEDQLIMNKIWEDLQGWKGGLAAKFVTKKGVRNVISFIHIDTRGEKARWMY